MRVLGRWRRGAKQVAHLWASSKGGPRNYWWIVMGLTMRDRFAFHTTFWLLARAVMKTTPSDTDLTRLSEVSSGETQPSSWSNDEQLRLERLQWLLWLAGLVIPGAHCLPKALAAWWAVKGWDSRLVIGVRAESQALAHAWVVAGNHPIGSDSFAIQHVYQEIWSSSTPQNTSAHAFMTETYPWTRSEAATH
jgi:Transglutaminase-like superfamily